MTSRRVLFIQYTNPAAYPPLEHVSRLLTRDDWQALFLGVGAFGADRLEFPADDKMRVLRMPFSRRGWRQKLHYLRYALWVLTWALRWRPTLVYASDPLACPVALLLSYCPGLLVVYHEHDSPAAGGSFFQRVCLAARRRLARRVRVNVLPNERRAELFAHATGAADVACVWNCPSLEELAPPRGQCETDDLWVLYHGSIGPTKLPPTVLDAMKLLPQNVKLRVIGYETVGETGYVQALKEKAERDGIGARVEFNAAMPRYELLRWCARADVGLAFMPKKSDNLNEQSMAGASNKPFDYLSCGLALLVSDLPEWRAMFVDSRYALACDVEEPESIAAALRWYLENRAEMRQMGELGRRRIASAWNYETRFLPVMERLAVTCD